MLHGAAAAAALAATGGPPRSATTAAPVIPAWGRPIHNAVLHPTAAMRAVRAAATTTPATARSAAETTQVEVQAGVAGVARESLASAYATLATTLPRLIGQGAMFLHGLPPVAISDRLSRPCPISGRWPTGR
ncbi:hypothetical protein [Kutzneria sp. NPDC052558]|uniref:hypothetical protein n=1 Tax=Kutzneria sp. NPDC052558 TaxID=3364121 RepID=UPI0037C983D5